MIFLYISFLILFYTIKFPWWRYNLDFGVPRILMYHQVTPQPLLSNKKWCLDPKQFERQILWLKRHGWTSRTMSELIEGHGNQSYCLTFDDGFENFITYVLPLLIKHQVKATLFCLSDVTSNLWDQPKVPATKLLTHNQIQECVRSGLVELASHGATHKNLTRLSSEALIHEISHSKTYFESSFDVEIKGFAYPFGQYDDKVLKCVKQSGYDYALAVKNQATPWDDLFEITRLTIDGRFKRRFDFPYLINKGTKGWL